MWKYEIIPSHPGWRRRRRDLHPPQKTGKAEASAERRQETHEPTDDDNESCRRSWSRVAVTIGLPSDDMKLSTENSTRGDSDNDHDNR